MIRLYILLTIFFIANSIPAQDRTLQGLVTDEKSNEPIIGASILIKNSDKGTITDIDGKFSLTVSENDFLVFSYIGYASQEIGVRDQQNLLVALKTEDVLLDQVVIVEADSAKQ